MTFYSADVAVDVNASTSPETGTPEPLKGSGMRIIFQDLRYVIDVVDEEAKAKAKAKAGKTFFGKTVLKEKNILRNVSGVSALICDHWRRIILLNSYCRLIDFHGRPDDSGDGGFWCWQNIFAPASGR